MMYVARSLMDASWMRDIKGIRDGILSRGRSLVLFQGTRNKESAFKIGR
jgi:hypothetical protein